MFGYVYLLNKNTGEVHLASRANPGCGIDKMSPSNMKYLTKRQYANLKYTRLGKVMVNGCRHCNKVTDIY